MGVATHLHLGSMDTLESDMRLRERTEEAMGELAEYKGKLVSTHGIPLLPSHLLNLPSTQPTMVSRAPQVEVKPEQMLSGPYSYPFALVLQLQSYQTSSGQHLPFLGVLSGHC